MFVSRVNAAIEPGTCIHLKRNVKVVICLHEEQRISFEKFGSEKGYFILPLLRVKLNVRKDLSRHKRDGKKRSGKIECQYDSQ